MCAEGRKKLLRKFSIFFSEDALCVRRCKSRKQGDPQPKFLSGAQTSFCLTLAPSCRWLCFDKGKKGPLWCSATEICGSFYSRSITKSHLKFFDSIQSNHLKILIQCSFRFNWQLCYRFALYAAWSLGFRRIQRWVSFHSDSQWSNIMWEADRDKNKRMLIWLGKDRESQKNYALTPSVWFLLALKKNPYNK